MSALRARRLHYAGSLAERSGASTVIALWPQVAATQRRANSPPQENMMQPEKHDRQDEEQARRRASGQAEDRPPKHAQPGAGDDRHDAETMGDGVIGGAPGKGLDNVGGPGLGVPPGGKNRSGKSGASGSTED